MKIKENENSFLVKNANDEMDIADIILIFGAQFFTFLKKKSYLADPLFITLIYQTFVMVTLIRHDIFGINAVCCCVDVNSCIYNISTILKKLTRVLYYGE